MRFVAEHVVDVVIERIGARALVQRLVDAIPGTDEDTNLLDRDYQMSLLAWREKHALEGVARRLRKGFDADADLFEVFNAAQDHLLLAAQAHIDARILEAFSDAVEAVEDPGHEGAAEPPGRPPRARHDRAGTRAGSSSTTG